MADITQEITLYAGDAPNRNTQPNVVFSTNADFFAGYFADVPPEYNTFATQANALRVEVNTSKDDAATSAAESASSAASSASTANFKGEWSTLTGAAVKPYSASENGTIWALLNDLADVTTSQPSTNPSDWLATGVTQITYSNAGTQTFTRQAVNTYINRWESPAVYTLDDSGFLVGDKVYISKLFYVAGVITINTTGLAYLPDFSSATTHTLDTLGTVCYEKIDPTQWIVRAA